MNRLESEISAYKSELLEFLQEELEANGGDYQRWYDDLQPFRTYMESKYVGRKFGKQMYTVPYVYNKYGDYLDHHLLSYIAPMNFERYGWNDELKSPAEQVEELSKWFGQSKVPGGGRFVYVALPNKGMIYTRLICEEDGLMTGKSCLVPQWRKYIKDLVDSSTEVLDLYPVFKKHFAEFGYDNLLFTKEHNLSAVGAKLVADTISDYIKRTTDTIESTCEIEQEVQLLYPYNLVNSKVPSFIDKYYLNKINNGNSNYPYWNQKVDSDIKIFGDCSLQSHSHLGAGIAANLAFNLQHHIYDGGRQLIFDNGQTINEISLENLKKMRDSKIAIYVAFASASFVRSSVFLTSRPKAHHFLDRPRSNYNWSTLTLK